MHLWRAHASRMPGRQVHGRLFAPTACAGACASPPWTAYAAPLGEGYGVGFRAHRMCQGVRTYTLAPARGSSEMDVCCRLMALLEICVSTGDRLAKQRAT